MPTKIHDFKSKDEAQAEKLRLQQLLPPTKSAYKPSGTLPGNGFAYMLAGAAGGVPGGVVGGVLIAIVGMLATWLLVSINVLIGETCNLIFWLPVLITIGVGLATFFGMYAAIGISAAAIVGAAGRRGKNRSPWTAALMAMASALAAVAPFWLLMHQESGLPTKQVSDVLQAVFATGTFGVVCAVIGAITATIAAGATAHEAVLAAKFCEPCDLYMVSVKLMPISFQGASEVVKSLQVGQMEVAGATLSGEFVDETRPLLFHCPQCRAGYIEATAKFEAKYPKKDKPNKNETLSAKWSAISAPLTPAQVDALDRATASSRVKWPQD
jgi:hypothetical protein